MCASSKFQFKGEKVVFDMGYGGVGFSIGDTEIYMNFFRGRKPEHGGSAEDFVAKLRSYTKEELVQFLMCLFYNGGDD